MKPAAFATAAFLAFASLSFAEKIELKVLSGRPEMVSGGSALVLISGPSLNSVKVSLNGQLISGSFRPGRIPGTLLGRVEGLKPGTNVLEARDGHGSQKIILTNHPIGGPVFSGPHQQPFICQTEFAGLEKAADADCNAPTRVQYFYRSTKRLTPAETKKAPDRGDLGAGYLPLNPTAELPSDVATTTTTDGNKVKFIVRVETGTINRSVYRIAFLHQPGDPLPDPWTRIPGWNGRLVYSFGGGARTGFRQGQAPVPLDLGAVSTGYAAAGSTSTCMATMPTTSSTLKRS